MSKPSQKHSLLLVDDDPLILDSLAMLLEDEYELITASTRDQAKTQLQKIKHKPNIALVDLGLPPKPHSPEEGFSLIKDLLGFNRKIKTLVLSGQNEQQNIQHALTLGAVDFIPKPCDLELLQARLNHQVMILGAEDIAEADVSQPILGESQVIQTLKSLIDQFAEQPFPVLVEGESGSGKELVAEQLYKLSSRSNGKYMTVNCAAFTSELLESQLFGHKKGSFTGATENKSGFFHEANDGCLFLDEVGELPLDLQSKLLRVLESGEYHPIGETTAQFSNARIIAATNRDLREEVRQGRFRKDLFHRLSVLTIHVPPLRQRGDDCFILLEHFCRLYASGKQSFMLDKYAKERFKQYFFPGNVRELRNIVIRLGAKYPSQEVTLQQLNDELETSIDADSIGDITLINDQVLEQELFGDHFNLDRTLDQWEVRYIKLALKKAEGNLSKAARLLGVNRTTLYSRLQRLSIEEP